MMPYDGRDDGWQIARIMRSIREAERRTLERIAAVILCCDYCARPLKLTGYSPAGGKPVTLATCPHCDRYRKGDDE